MNPEDLDQYDGKAVIITNNGNFDWKGIIVNRKFFPVGGESIEYAEGEISPRYSPCTHLAEEIKQVINPRNPNKNEQAIITAIKTGTKKVSLEFKVDI